MEIFGIGPAELLLIFVLALIFIGPGKMPEVAASAGKAIRAFQQASAELTDALNTELAATQAARESAEQALTAAAAADAADVSPVVRDSPEFAASPAGGHPTLVGATTHAPRVADSPAQPRVSSTESRPGSLPPLPVALLASSV